MKASILFILFSLALQWKMEAQTLPPGPQVLTFFSDLDDSEQPYSIYIPPGYDVSKQYPLVVMLHGAGSNHRLALRRVFGKSNLPGENDVEASRYFPPWKDIEMIVVAPFARGTAGYQGIVEKDVMDMLADVKRRFSIDENRMYLTGLSMGGGGTLSIGLSHPDLWAAIAPVCPSPPPGLDVLAPNALNMAVQFVHGDADPTVPVSISRDWVARLKALESPVVEYLELPGVDHWSWVQAYEDGRIFDWFAKYQRSPYPDHVRHATHDLQHGKSYWVRIEEKTPGMPAIIDAKFIGGNSLDIKTTNVSAFSIDLTNHPKFSSKSELNVSLNGQAFRLQSDSSKFSFSIKELEDEWAGTPAIRKDHQKVAGLEGPIQNAFETRHVYVYGTADDPSPEVLQSRIDTALKAADWSAYRGEFLGRVKFFPRVVADKDVRQSDYEDANLILFGTTETNSVIAAMADSLPMHLDVSATSGYGLIYIFPNANGHYVVVNSGAPWWRAINPYGRKFAPVNQDLLRSFGDYCLYRNNRIILAYGVFDNHWELSEEQKETLIKTKLVRMKN